MPIDYQAKKPRPIIVKFSFYNYRDRVLKRYREVSKSAREARTNDGANTGASANPINEDKVRVGEDFPERVRKVRASLIPFLQQSLDSGKNAYLRFDKLIVNGYAYTYDESKQRPAPVFRK